MKYKPVIEIDKNDTIRYRILNGLSKNREYHINSLNDEKRVLLKRIGQTVAELKPDFPVVWHTSRSRHDDKRFLKLPPNIKLIEEKGRNKIFFKWKTR